MHRHEPRLNYTNTTFECPRTYEEWNITVGLHYVLKLHRYFLVGRSQSNFFTCLSHPFKLQRYVRIESVVLYALLWIDKSIPICSQSDKYADIWHRIIILCVYDTLIFQVYTTLLYYKHWLIEVCLMYNLQPKIRQ